MARFERGNQFVELWTERPERPIDPATGDRPFALPELFERRGPIAERVAPEKVTLRHAFSAGAEYRDRCAELLEQGWHRVRDPAREAWRALRIGQRVAVIDDRATVRRSRSASHQNY
jgi:hypothetical protein